MGSIRRVASPKPRDAQLPTTLEISLVARLLGWKPRRCIASAGTGSWPVHLIKANERRYVVSTSSLSRWLKSEGISDSAASWLSAKGEFEGVRIDAQPKPRKRKASGERRTA